MRPSTCRRLSLLVLLFGRAHTGISLALPQPAVTPTPIALPLGPRADGDFLTTYGFFDSPSPAGSSLAAGSSALAHIPDVFIAMAQQTALTTSTFAIKLAQTAPLTVSDSILTSAVYPTAPPMLGPGLVVLPTPVLPAIATPIPTRATPGTSNDASSIANHAASSRRIIVFGSVIGSILLFTLFLFFLLDPAIGSKVIGICCRSRKSPAKKVKREKATAPSAANESWVSVVYLPNTNDQTLIDDEKHNARARNNEKSLPDVPNQLTPPSKFSICSSSHVDSSRDSAISSGTESGAVKPAVSFAPGQKPVRPPRPPTADSPALSDSVYLACSDKPYVVVAPQSFNQADMHSQNPPRRNLTPSEFFALHVPGVLASLSASSSWGKKAERASVAASHFTKRESQHSRTKSEPPFGIGKAQGGSNADPDDDDSDIQGAMIQRLMKHRRSRSASGWAYPDRPKSRRHLNS